MIKEASEQHPTYRYTPLYSKLRSNHTDSRVASGAVGISSGEGLSGRQGTLFGRDLLICCVSCGCVWQHHSPGVLVLRRLVVIVVFASGRCHGVTGSAVAVSGVWLAELVTMAFGSISVQ